ncbi:MAG TPA: TIGR03560 family F420-dependent LLM class oxidoreductase [Vitreimonas sp.]|nr:TIGR03560 family F420-dependent LLM class oxidoreductase [Vitreimonas sp.]
MLDAPFKLGALIWPQYTQWQPMLDAAARAEDLGYDSLWTWDHLYPIVGSDEGPIFEGYLTLAGFASVTSRSTLGLMVGANTFRNPALTAKTATTLDHLSGGRVVLGIGGAWFETEHIAYGLDFGSGFGERLDRLDEAVEVMRGMLNGRPVSARGEHYHVRDVRNDPPPVHGRMPLLIGGGGEKKTLRTVARYADMWNIGGSPDAVRHKDEVLRRWCDEVGRAESEIERTLQGGSVILRADRDEARRVAADVGRINGGWKGPGFAGTTDDLVARFRPYLELGFRHIYVDFPAPFDEETMTRVAHEVRPALEVAAAAVG